LVISNTLFSQIKNISQVEVIRIANEKVIKLGFSLDSLDMRIAKTVNNIDSLKRNYPYYSVSPMKKHVKKVIKILKNHCFWFIYYTEKGSAFGWDLSIFVDSKNGKILTYFLGE